MVEYCAIPGKNSIDSPPCLQVDFALEMYADVLYPALDAEAQHIGRRAEPYRGRPRKTSRDHGIFFFRYALCSD